MALIVQTPALLSVAAGVILASLVLYGVGRNLAGNTFQALLADRFAPGVPRSRAAKLQKVIKLKSCRLPLCAHPGVRSSMAKPTGIRSADVDPECARPTGAAQLAWDGLSTPGNRNFHFVRGKQT